jgi:hypothetical protein
MFRVSDLNPMLVLEKLKENSRGKRVGERLVIVDERVSPINIEKGPVDEPQFDEPQMNDSLTATQRLIPSGARIVSRMLTP